MQQALSGCAERVVFFFFPLCLEASSELRPSQKRDIREANDPREPWKAVAAVGFMNTSLKDKPPL